MARIMTIGEILVEIMATERGQSPRTGHAARAFPSALPPSSSTRWAGSDAQPGSSAA